MEVHPPGRWCDVARDGREARSTTPSSPTRATPDPWKAQRGMARCRVQWQWHCHRECGARALLACVENFESVMTMEHDDDGRISERRQVQKEKEERGWHERMLAIVCRVEQAVQCFECVNFSTELTTQLNKSHRQRTLHQENSSSEASNA